MKVIIATSDREKRICYQMRYKVMCEELGWMEQQNTSIPEETDEYDEIQSLSLLVVDDSGNPSGTARIIQEGEIPVPIDRHFELEPLNEIERKHGRIISKVEASRLVIPKNKKLFSYPEAQVLLGIICRIFFHPGDAYKR